MILPRAVAAPGDVARHYDELDPFYRALWGEHLHHGLWSTGDESARDAAIALVNEVAARAAVVPGSRVCDVGCGYGAPARQLAAGGATVTALTLSPVQHAHAVRASLREPGPRFLLRDWLANGLPPASFDAVLAIECLAHMPGKPAALAEAFRVLEPGGRLVACVWLAAPDPKRWEVRHLLRPICDEGRLPGLPHGEEYTTWAREAGFEDVELEDVSQRVARTWVVCSHRVLRGLFWPSAWRYLLDRRNRERRFVLSVLRLRLAFRTGAMRYGILTARRPGTARP